MNFGTASFDRFKNQMIDHFSFLGGATGRMPAYCTWRWQLFFQLTLRGNRRKSFSCQQAESAYMHRDGCKQRNVHQDAPANGASSGVPRLLGSDERMRCGWHLFFGVDHCRGFDSFKDESDVGLPTSKWPG